jgi:hypothetical protein
MQSHPLCSTPRLARSRKLKVQQCAKVSIDGLSHVGTINFYVLFEFRDCKNLYYLNDYNGHLSNEHNFLH